MLLHQNQKAVVIQSADDKLLVWLQQLDCWPDISELWSSVKPDGFVGPIPFHVELELKDFLRLDLDCKAILNMLFANSNGIYIKTLGTEPEFVDEELETCNCSWTILEKLRLVRIQDKQLLKPLNVAFDDRVKYLTGVVTAL